MKIHKENISDNKIRLKDVLSIKINIDDLK